MPERLPDIPPFHRMLRRLKANGFLLGVDTYLRVAEYWQVVETNEDEALTTDELRTQIKAQLSALLCRSAEQQELFGQVFDKFLPEGIKPLVNDGENRPTQEQRTDLNPPTPIKTDDKKRRERSIPERPFTPPNPSEKIAPVLPLLNFPEEPLRVWNLTEMGPAMTPLQEKVWTDSTEWDVPGTIRAITRAGGFPKLVFKKRKQAPRYLALIEQQSPRDHLAGYAAELVKEINRRDLEAEFYFFDKNPGHCWKEQREQQTHISIERLRSEWSGARLLLLSHASHFVNPATGTPSNLALELPDDFSNVALLATNANVEWGAAERSLSSLMPVVPMSVEGLGKLMAAWNGAAQPSFEEWQAILPEQSPPKLTDGYRQPDPSEVFMEVYRYLGNEAFVWLCACAVYPELYFELTCILHDEAIPLSADLSQWQRNERWNQALRLLSRLEWFRKGELPETLAEELKKNLTPADLLLVEGEIKRILAISKNQVSDQSYAAELRNELFDWLASQSFRVLWIDDRPQNNEQYRDSWSKTLGIHFKLATTSSEAHGYLNSERFDLVISDLGRPGEELTGQITLDIVAGRAPVVFFTDKRGLNLRGTLLSAGAREVTNSVGGVSELVRGELRKKFPVIESIIEVGNEADQNVNKISVYIAYSKDDIEHYNSLTRQLTYLEKVLNINVLSTTLNRPIEELDEETRNSLGNSDVFLILISKNILSSDYFHQLRLPRIIEKGRAGALVIPIIAEVCDWEGLVPELKQFQVCLPFGVAVSQSNSNEAWGEVERQINNSIINWQQDKTTKSKNSDSTFEVQRMLQKLGFFEGEADGIAGVKTKAAVAAFQKSAGLVADGILGPQTRRALEKAVEEMVAIGQPTSDKTKVDNIKDLISEGEIKGALEECLRGWPDNIDLVLLNDNYTKLQQDSIRGIIANEDYQTKLAQITHGLLDLLGTFKKGATEVKADKTEATNIDRKKSELKELLVQGSDLALGEIKKVLNTNSDKYSDYLSIERLYQDIARQLLQGVISNEEATLGFNKIRQQLLEFIETLKESDLIGGREEGNGGRPDVYNGELFFRIPKEMEVGVEAKCLVRLAFDRQVILEGLDLQSDDVMKDLRISDVMGVELIDPESNPSYSIRTLNESVQFVEKGLATEWIFYVTPQQIEVSALVLKVSIIEIINGIERKRDQVLELDVKILPPDRPSQSYK